MLSAPAGTAGLGRVVGMRGSLIAGSLLVDVGCRRRLSCQARRYRSNDATMARPQSTGTLRGGDFRERRGASIRRIKGRVEASVSAGSQRAQKCTLRNR